jgi:hypothetical protein
MPTAKRAAARASREPAVDRFDNAKITRTRRSLLYALPSLCPPKVGSTESVFALFEDPCYRLSFA